jgi:hypothetical protein
VARWDCVWCQGGGCPNCETKIDAPRPSSGSSSESSGPGCLKTIGWGILILYVIFYFVYNPQARSHPLSIVTDTYTNVQEWLSYWAGRAGSHWDDARM